jgi:hypothetical protein
VDDGGGERRREREQSEHKRNRLGHLRIMTVAPKASRRRAGVRGTRHG